MKKVFPKDLLKVVYNDIKDVTIRSFTDGILTDGELEMVEQLRSTGFVVLPGYWSRERAAHCKARLEPIALEGRNQELENGAYCRHWEGRAHDTSVTRIYHSDGILPDLREFRYDPKVLRVMQSVYGVPFYSGCLIFQHNRPTNIDTRYYHVDWYGKEFKAMLYLDDVDDTNGPFTYLPGSHKAGIRRLRKLFLEGENSTGFRAEELGKLVQGAVQVVGEAGTLIIADVRGIHRGSPQLGRSRSVLSNYMYRTPGDQFLDR